MAIQYKTLPLGPLETNCYIVYDDVEKEAFLIDKALDVLGVTLRFVFLTHGHADHIGALQEVRNHKDVPVYIGKGDVDLIANSRNNLSMFLGKEIVITSPEHIVTDGEVINFAGVPFKVIETPGHTPGGLCLYGAGLLFAGDTLFRCSVGRTDFYGGDSHVLVSSIEEKLMKLPDDTVVLPGHGPATDIGYERRNNPFLGGGW